MICNLTGDCRTVLQWLPTESVHCVVTSPPYWGLRDYGTAKWEGGDPACSHQVRLNPRIESSTLGGGKLTTGHQREGFSRWCPRCGACRIDSQIGLEPSFTDYIETMVAVFREVCRVLRKDGTLWLNLGDCYATGAGKVGECPGGGAQGARWRGPITQPNRMPQHGLKSKDLCGIPWRVAFALQADGWYLRSDIIWHKPNPMPESVTDRPTKAHEYLFLLSKSAKYYYDAEAIKEPATNRAPGNKRHKYTPQYNNEKDEKHRTKAGLLNVGSKEYRNKRTVWTISTAPFPEAHFATFPPALVEPCILAGCPEGGVVLDPFSGAGTVGLVAARLQRKAILIELNSNYVEMATNRIKKDSPLFVHV
jgi:DNA modification methylase